MRSDARKRAIDISPVEYAEHLAVAWDKGHLAHLDLMAQVRRLEVGESITEIAPPSNPYRGK